MFAVIPTNQPAAKVQANHNPKPAAKAQTNQNNNQAVRRLLNGVKVEMDATQEKVAFFHIVNERHYAATMGNSPRHQVARAEATAARERIIEAHQPLIERLAAHLATAWGQQSELRDLLQEGYRAILEGIEKFSLGHPYTFGSWVAPRVWKAMCDFLRASNGVGERHLANQLRRLQIALTHFVAEHGREAGENDYQALAASLNLTTEKFRSLILTMEMQKCVSLEGDGEQDGEDRVVLSDHIAEPVQQSQAANRKLEAQVSVMLASLSGATEARIIAMSYGIGGPALTNPAIAELLGFGGNRDWVRQMRLGAEQRLRDLYLDPTGELSLPEVEVEQPEPATMLRWRMQAPVCSFCGKEYQSWGWQAVRDYAPLVTPLVGQDPLRPEYKLVCATCRQGENFSRWQQHNQQLRRRQLDTYPAVGRMVIKEIVVEGEVVLRHDIEYDYKPAKPSKQPKHPAIEWLNCTGCGTVVAVNNVASLTADQGRYTNLYMSVYCRQNCGKRSEQAGANLTTSPAATPPTALSVLAAALQELRAVDSPLAWEVGNRIFRLRRTSATNSTTNSADTAEQDMVEWNMSPHQPITTRTQRIHSHSESLGPSFPAGYGVGEDKDVPSFLVLDDPFAVVPEVNDEQEWFIGESLDLDEMYSFTQGMRVSNDEAVAANQLVHDQLLALLPSVDARRVQEARAHNQGKVLPPIGLACLPLLDEIEEARQEYRRATLEICKEYLALQEKYRNTLDDEGHTVFNVHAARKAARYDLGLSPVEMSGVGGSVKSASPMRELRGRLLRLRQFTKRVDVGSELLAYSAARRAVRGETLAIPTDPWSAFLAVVLAAKPATATKTAKKPDPWSAFLAVVLAAKPVTATKTATTTATTTCAACGQTVAAYQTYRVQGKSEVKAVCLTCLSQHPAWLSKVTNKAERDSAAAWLEIEADWIAQVGAIKPPANASIKCGWCHQPTDEWEAVQGKAAKAICKDCRRQPLIATLPVVQWQWQEQAATEAKAPTRTCAYCHQHKGLMVFKGQTTCDRHRPDNLMMSFTGLMLAKPRRVALEEGSFLLRWESNYRQIVCGCYNMGCCERPTFECTHEGHI